VRFFHRFAKEFPDTHLVRLKRNYRSTETILEASHQVIQTQHPDMDTQQRVFSRIQGIDTIVIMETASAKAEAVAIGKTIESMVGGTGFHSMDFGTIDDMATRERSFADFAVLFRTNAQRMVIEEILGQAGIPCQQTDQQAFQEQPVVAKLLAVLRLMEGQACYADLVHMKDLTSPAVTPATLQAFKDWAYAQQLPLWQAMQSALTFPVPGVAAGDQHQLVDLVQLLQGLSSESGDMSVVQRIELILAKTQLLEGAEQDEQEVMPAIMETAREFGPQLDRYLAEQAIQTDTDLVSQKAEKVALLTMHAAKGLEFPVVFVSGCEDGLIPYRSPGAPGFEDARVEEEQRLFYVAMTRAREQLILSWSRKRSLYGKTAIQAPSPFLNAIENLKQETQLAGAAKQRQLSLF
jgi:superfamily I DNA/RNA helicase